MSKAKALAAEINKVLGVDAVKVASDSYFTVRHLSTGELPVDILLGGGFPIGRTTEIYGDYSSLKSWVALRAIATTQESGGTCALLDMEHAFDSDWATECGVDVAKLIVMHPDTGEDAIAMSEILMHNGTDLIVWDSVAATQPKADQEQRPGEDKQPARRASMMSKGLPRLTSANKNTTALVMINQTRTNVGMTFGSSEVVPGGKALPFFASMRVRMARAGRITEDIQTHNGEKMVTTKMVTGYRIKCSLEKSKLNRPHRETWFVFSTETGGIDVPNWLVSQGEELGLVTQPSKGWYSMTGAPKEKMRRAALVQAVRDDDKLSAVLQDAIKARHE